MGCCLWGRTESDTTEVTQQQHVYITDCLPQKLTQNYKSIKKKKKRLHKGHLNWILKGDRDSLGRKEERAFQMHTGCVKVERERSDAVVWGQ